MKNKSHLVYTIIFFSIILFVTSCINAIDGKGNIITQVRNVSAFEEVELANSSDVEIYKDSTFKVEVSDYENIIQYTETKVEGKKLRITTVSGKSIGNSKCHVIIHTPYPLHVLKLSGSGNIYLKGEFNDITNLELIGSGDIEGEKTCNTNNLTASISGSGNIKLQGTSNTVTVKLLGSGNINLIGMKSKTADCSVSGSGNVSISVSDKLKASIIGSGNIDYYGNPVLTQSVTGSGEVIHH